MIPMFPLWAQWSIVGYLIHSVAATTFNEALQATGLLGAHFGVPGLPGAFDYVIVGGGTAGLTVARRLAANTSNTVAVIEAGGFYEFDNGNLTEIPADAGYFVGSAPAEKNPLIDWEQYTEPQVGFGGRTALYTQGKTLGGSSARNLMFYHRGTIGTYQIWADKVGDDSYTFENLLPYFERSVQFTPNTAMRPANASAEYDSAVFSLDGGPLQVAYPNWVNAISSWFALGTSAIGLQSLPGFTNGSLLGYSYVANTIDPASQTRSSSESSFLREALTQTTNLALYKSTLAKQILFDQDKRANGVIVNSGGVTYQISANKEVIVSAGTFRSPQLLMVSGIGPPDVLEQHDIPIVAPRLGVGQNMWDQILFGPSYEVDVQSHGSLQNPAYLAQATESYIQNQTGILTNVGGDFIAFAKLPPNSTSATTRKDLDATFGSDWPDIELLSFDGYAGYNRDLLGDAPKDGKNYAAAFVALVAPFSRGNVTIVSNDTSVNPSVNPNWLTDARDQEAAIAAFKVARSVFQAQAVQPIVIGSEVFPGLNVSTDEQILSLIRQSALTPYHAAATNAMGSPNDSMAVIDSSARVIGVQGLRVVDASSFPILPPGHPQATVYALAEKIADMILHGQ